MVETEKELQVTETEVLSELTNKPALKIFLTEEDRVGTDLAKMSNFFDGFLENMKPVLKSHTAAEAVSNFPIGNVEVLAEVLEEFKTVKEGSITLVADMESLGEEINEKLKAGVYKIGESRQVDGNMRAVIIGEDNQRVKDITLKKVEETPETEGLNRNIANMLEMRQFAEKLDRLQSFQTYQMDVTRDQTFVAPFLDARTMILEAEEVKSEESRKQLLKQADDTLRKLTQAVYTDLNRTVKAFADLVSHGKIKDPEQAKILMRYLVEDMQISSKYIGVRLRLLTYLGEEKLSEYAFLQYRHMLYEFFHQALTDSGMTAGELMQNYFPYTKENMNFWYQYQEELKPALERNMEMIRTDDFSKERNEIYLVSVSDCPEDETAEAVLKDGDTENLSETVKDAEEASSQKKKEETEDEVITSPREKKPRFMGKNKKEKKLRKCICGRIITDPSNKKGLCPECALAAGLVGNKIAQGVKLYGPALAEKYGPKVAKKVKEVTPVLVDKAKVMAPVLMKGAQKYAPDAVLGAASMAAPMLKACIPVAGKMYKVCKPVAVHIVRQYGPLVLKAAKEHGPEAVHAVRRYVVKK